MSDEPREQTPLEPLPEAEPALVHPVPQEEPEPDLRRPRRPQGPPVDGMAIAAFVVALVGVHLAAVVLGHLALARIREGGRGGRGLARAALVIGYAGLAITLALAVLYFAVLAPLVTLPT